MITTLLVLFALAGCVGIMATAIESGKRLALETETEESVDDIIERHRRERVARRVKDMEAWDKWYLESLPVEEHPDYFELDLASDSVETIVTKTASGHIVGRWESRANAWGVPYSLTPDYVARTARVKVGRLAWDVPLDSLDPKYIKN